MTETDLTDSEIRELRERKRQRLLEEAKSWPIDKPLPEDAIVCPRCGKKAEFSKFQVILGRKFKIYKCKECKIEFIPDIGRYRVCVIDPDHPKIILPRDCKLCKFFPGKTRVCPYFRKITDMKKVINAEGWSKW